MFTWVAAHEFMLIGIVIMVVVGPAIGNYACSVVYRLPRGKTPFERHPYCGHCNADLKPIDLFPIGSWLSTRGKCRYCAGKIPAIYTVIEAVCGAVFIAYFLHFGMSEHFLLYVSYATFAVILAAIQWQHGWLSVTLYSYALLAIALARTLTEHTIYGVVQSAFVMMFLMLCVSRIVPKSRTITPFEKPWIWWCVLMGALVPMAQWSLLVPIMAIQFLMPNKLRVIVYAGAALALPLCLGEAI